MPGPGSPGRQTEVGTACQAAVQQLKRVVDQVELEHDGHVCTFWPQLAQAELLQWPC